MDARSDMIAYRGYKGSVRLLSCPCFVEEISDEPSADH